MADVTEPDDIVKWTNPDAGSLVAESQAQGDSIQAAFDRRQRYGYVWANAAARTSQTGMTQGSLGYQVDTKTEYIYDAGAWRLASSYIEMDKTGGSIANSAYVALTGWVVDNTASTDVTFATISGNALNIVRPGIYAISLTTRITNPGTTGFTTATLDTAVSPVDWISIEGYTQSVSTVAIPLIRVTVANTKVYLWTFQNSGAATTIVWSKLRMTRIS